MRTLALRTTKRITFSMSHYILNAAFNASFKGVNLTRSGDAVFTQVISPCNSKNDLGPLIVTVIIRYF